MNKFILTLCVGCSLMGTACGEAWTKDGPRPWDNTPDHEMTIDQKQWKAIGLLYDDIRDLRTTLADGDTAILPTMEKWLDDLSDSVIKNRDGLRMLSEYLHNAIEGHNKLSDQVVSLAAKIDTVQQRLDALEGKCK